jgi:hypothetical protein
MNENEVAFSRKFMSTGILQKVKELRSTMLAIEDFYDCKGNETAGEFIKRKYKEINLLTSLYPVAMRQAIEVRDILAAARKDIDLIQQLRSIAIMALAEDIQLFLDLNLTICLGQLKYEMDLWLKDFHKGDFINVYVNNFRGGRKMKSLKWSEILSALEKDIKAMANQV